MFDRISASESFQPCTPQFFGSDALPWLTLLSYLGFSLNVTFFGKYFLRPLLCVSALTCGSQCPLLPLSSHFLFWMVIAHFHAFALLPTCNSSVSLFPFRADVHHALSTESTLKYVLSDILMTQTVWNCGREKDCKVVVWFKRSQREKYGNRNMGMQIAVWVCVFVSCLGCFLRYMEGW